MTIEEFISVVERIEQLPAPVTLEQKPPRMLTLKEASEETGLAYSLLRKMCKAGKIPHVRAGSKTLINARKMTEYLNHGDDQDFGEAE